MKVAKIEWADTTAIVQVQGCNLSCNWCDHQELKSDKDVLDRSAESVFKSIEEAESLLVEGGEPLLYPRECRDLALRCRANDIRTVLITNGILLWKYPYIVNLFDSVVVEVHGDVDYFFGGKVPDNVYFVVPPFGDFSSIVRTLNKNKIKRIVIPSEWRKERLDLIDYLSISAPDVVIDERRLI